MSPRTPRTHSHLLRQIGFLGLTVLLLGGCATDKVVRSNETMRAAIKSAPAQIKAEMQPRIEESKTLGPVVKETPPEELRKNQRTLIGKTSLEGDVQTALGESGKTFKVTVNFVNTDMRNVAKLFAEITGANVIVGDEVKSLVTAKLRNAPWDVALDGILKMYGLAWHHDRRNNLIRIHSQETLDKRMEAERKRIEDVRKTAEGKLALETRQTEIFRLYYTKPAKLKDEIQAIFKTTGQATIPVEAIVDERTNSLIVKGTREEMDLVAKLIEKLDIRTRQILIEAFIVEALDNFQEEFGARTGLMKQASNWGQTGTIGGTIGATAAGTAANVPADMTFATNSGLVSNAAPTAPLGSIGVMLQGTSAALKVELTALEKLGLSKIVSNPRLFTMDNEEATITDGVQIAYPVAGTGAGQITYEFKDAALKLVVTPTIVGDGNVQLAVTVNKDTPVYTTTPPGIDKREIKSKLLIKDGAIAVIGGIYTQTKADNTNKVPGLGDIPVIGGLFRSNQQIDQRRELLIFLSPSII